jgi:GNAT superfamily N-acetyltransferase
MALSGLGGADGNVIFCFDGERPDALRRSAEDVARANVPVVVMIGAGALGWAQILADAGLVCVGSAPFMHLPADRIQAGGVDPAMRALRSEDLAEARAVVGAAYAQGSPMADIALPDEAVGSPVWGLWGLEVDGGLVSVVTTTRVGDALGVWSMSTPARHQGHGYGRRLLDAVLAGLAADIGHVLLYASPSGERLYRAMGFTTVEHWQQWSRPRWIPGRT